MSHLWILPCAIGVSALLLANIANATDVVIPNGTTEVVTQTLPDPGDTLTIQPGGAISTVGIAVGMNNSDQTVTNQSGGSISTTGNSAYGILSIGTDAAIANGGLISTAGDDSWGIYSTGFGAAIANGGLISTAGDTGWGIVSSGADAAITNNGSIVTTGNLGWGIVSTGVDATIGNYGSIGTAGGTGWGILSTGAGAAISNGGSIFTAGSDAVGIISTGADANISNGGSINTIGVGAIGIFAAGTNATITNSGTVISTQSSAIAFSQANATLNLQAGTAIQGGIVFTGAGNTLNIGKGLSTALDITGVATVESDNPFVINGTTVAVVDATGFGVQDEMLSDLTRVITDAVDGRLSAARAGSSAGTVAMNGMLITAVADAPGNEEAAIWAKALGHYRDQPSDGGDVGFDSLLGGVVAGIDGAMSENTRAGLFLGAAIAETHTDGNSQSIDSDSYFGGLYAGYAGGAHFLDMSLTAGLSEFDSDRRVANNLVPGGIEHAEADYDGVFISPSATIGMDVHMDNGSMLTPSLRARYAGLFLGSYDENGSSADLSVDSRDVHVFELRGQFAYGLAPIQGESGALDNTLRVGVDGSTSDGGSVDATLLGQSLNFAAGNDGEVARGFVGLDTLYTTNGGSGFRLGFEAGYDTEETFTAQAEAGFHIPL